MSRWSAGLGAQAHYWTQPANWQLAVFALVVVRLGMWWLFQHNLPRMEIHDGWYFYHGGDQGVYFKAAQSLVAGFPVRQTASAGWAFILAGMLKLMNGSQ